MLPSASTCRLVSTTQLLNRLSQHYSLPLHETPVGFNHICAWFLKDPVGVLMGGEESGGMTIKGHVLDGDGILMGLLLAELLAYQRKPLHEVINGLMQEFGEFYYGRNDVHTHAFPQEGVRTMAYDKKELTLRLTKEAPQRLLSHQVVQVNNSDGVKYLLDDDSWLLIRPSGTEPLLRIYAEARTREEVPQLLAAGHSLAESDGHSLADLQSLPRCEGGDPRTARRGATEYLERGTPFAPGGDPWSLPKGKAVRPGGRRPNGGDPTGDAGGSQQNHQDCGVQT